MRHLLVPGAGGQAWDWHRLVPLLDAAVAVELPAGDETAGLAEYADTIVAAAGPDPGPVVVVGHSMGGLSAPLVADRLDVRRLVLLNAMIPAPGESGAQWWEGSGHSSVDIGEFDEVEHFYHDLPAAVRAEALARPDPAQSERPSLSRGRWSTGPTCPPRCWRAPRTDSSRRTSSGGWRGSGSASTSRSCPVGTWRR